MNRVAVPSSANRLPDCSVFFISLGGTKLSAAALVDDGSIFTTPDVMWRMVPDFAATIDDEYPTGFSLALAEWSGGVLRGWGLGWRDVGLVGIGLPGPRINGLCYSFNLTRAFESGVDLRLGLSAAIQSAQSRHVPPISIALDAECDAGGELYHPQGRLYPRTSKAVVLNVATGIAAGIVGSGKVLTADSDFVRELGPPYDSGAGQIGRHLWFVPEDGEWQYHYAPHGALPFVSEGIRMTEYLSGPALATRLLLFLGENGCLPETGTWTDPSLSLESLGSLWNQLRNEKSYQSRVALMRHSAAPASGALLAWADRIYASSKGGKGGKLLAETLTAFARQTVSAFASAFVAWSKSPGWREFLGRVVLTGGVGIRLLSSADGDHKRSFGGLLNELLPRNISVERSILAGSAERGVWLFSRQLI